MGCPGDARDDDDDTKNRDAYANNMGPASCACLEGREARDVCAHRQIQDLMARRYFGSTIFYLRPNGLECVDMRQRVRLEVRYSKVEVFRYWAALASPWRIRRTTGR
jgi:hypothetical protein